jgi:hypothetical protein
MSLTWAKKSENGSPRSLAKAQVKRDTDAKMLKLPTQLTMMTNDMRAFVAATDLVAP